MKQTSKTRPARKAKAKKAARPKTARAKTARPKTARPKTARPKTATAMAKAKAAPPRKAAKAKKPVAAKRKARKSASVRKPKPAKPTSIERASAAGVKAAAADGSKIESPALAALEAALLDQKYGDQESGQASGPASNSPMAGAPETGSEADSDSGGTPGEFLGESPGDTPGESPGDTPARINKLVPTNAVHTTKRRAKRNGWQAPALAVGAVAAMLALVVLGHESAPPDVSPLEQRASVEITDSPLRGTDSSRVTNSIPESGAAPPPRVPSWHDEIAKARQALGEDPLHGLKVLELVELERMLQRLEMEPSRPDGIVDGQTEDAIRMYQQIAGIPVNGEPSRALLEDMREVVQMLDGTN